MGIAGQVLIGHEQIGGLPEELDVVVVATGAAIRRKVLEQLLSHARVRYLVLEKVLFQSVSDCLWAHGFLESHGTQAWVNFPRRQQPAYRQIQVLVAPDQPLEVRVAGSRWGLATSAVHFLDLVLFLGSGTRLRIDKFEAARFSSTRHAGCSECTGHLAGEAAPGQYFSISAWDQAAAPVRVTVESPLYRWVVDERSDHMLVQSSSAESGWKSESSSHPLYFQSQLTAMTVEGILEHGNCDLSSLDDALEGHLPFLRAWNARFAPGSDPDATACPIT